MQIKLFWLQDDTVVKEIDPFSVSLKHREGEIASLDITLLAQESHPSSLLMTYGDAPVFKGVAHGVPTFLNDHEVRLKFLALPPDLAKQREKLAPPSDSLFSMGILEAVPALFFADRVTHALSLSPVLPQGPVLRFDDQILKNTLTVKALKAPLSTIDLEISAQWVQELEGEFDVFPAIARAFPRGIVNTLTPQTLRLSWPQEGRSLRRSGYTVVESELQEITPPQTGALNLYPTRTTPFFDGVQTRRLKRSWLKGRLTLYWIYKQKRREVLQCRLERPYQGGGVTKKIVLQLGNLDGALDKTSATFFSTKRGKQALAYALEIAKAHLIYQSRTIVATFSVPLREGVFVQPNQSAHVVHPLLNRVGKVIEVSANITAEEAIAYIHVAFPYEETDWSKEGALCFQEGIADDLKGDFIQGIEVLNDSFAQTDLLQKGGYPDVPSTEIILDLKNLKTKETLEQVIQAETITWRR